ncbi:MAG: hypothetical protein K0S66_1559 [Sphingomonas sp.]|jgi:hypothetical protein|nr:hypothetical protein [Sphingomonas sp.]
MTVRKGARTDTVRAPFALVRAAASGEAAAAGLRSGVAAGAQFGQNLIRGIAEGGN